MRIIGSNIGYFEGSEITLATARMQVHIDRLQPLITKSIVEFENGDEVEAELVYEILEKHCSNCLRLGHKEKDFPEAKAQENSNKLSHSHSNKNHLQKKGDKSLTGTYHSTRNCFIILTTMLSQGQNLSLLPITITETETSMFQEAENTHLGSTQDTQLYTGVAGPSSQSSSKHNSVSGESTRQYNKSPPQRSYHQHRDWDITRNPSRGPFLQNIEIFESSRSRRPPLERIDQKETPIEVLPQAAMSEAIGELGEVMIQYSSCTYPSKISARRGRCRQAEEKGEVEETDAQMVRASLVA